ncbi:type II secretion system protein GspL [Congregibacter variabilis]|uniref:Type II secretion system protein L n=1 Tax=Congregibacter variabilis TaxID=3081200 RepID=A0ABZ0I775_9GAMM|nr:type II secretion system protein GspL [Congregibacter sp. IMCC43200]
MSDNLSVLFLRGDALHWLDAGEVYALSHDATEQKDRLRQSLAHKGHGVVFAVPGSEARLLELAVSPEERKHLGASLPFMLEESLSDSIDGVHFARMSLDRDHYAVAMVDRQSMQNWQEILGEFASLVPWVPEPLLLPWSPGEWTLVLEKDSTLLRYGRSLGTRIENALLPMLLETLGNESPAESVIVYGQDEAADLALLAPLGAVSTQWRKGGLASALLLHDQTETGINLLQGEFAPQLPYAKWWSQWRKVAALTLVALSIHLLSGWLDLRRLERENLVLRTEIQSVYRQVNPRGAVVDAQKQLQRQLDSLRGGGTGTTFTGLLAPLGDLFSPDSDLVLASLSYSQRNAELRVNLLAANFADVETLRVALEAAGFIASLESSSRSGDRVRARLRIGDRP